MDNILIIDDEKSLLDLLTVVFKKEGYGVKTAPSAARGFEILEKEEVDLVVTDIKMPGADGMDVLRFVRESRPGVPVILITAYGSISQAVEALKAGALDYVVKPFDVEELKIIVARGLAGRRLEMENVLLKRDLKERYAFEQMIGKSRPMQEIYTLIEKVADTDSTVLVTGESGTGKEMAARAIHVQSGRRDRPFVSINCAALPENLLESELFGHVRGAFTGAVSEKKGMFEAAQRGTLFLDEVGETSPWTQVKLLRALQDRRIRRVGGTEEIAVDVRIIAATNQDLKSGSKRAGSARSSSTASTSSPSRCRPEEEDRGHPPARRPFPPEVLRPDGQEAQAADARSRRDPRGLRLAGQHPRARERHRAHRGHRGPGDRDGPLPAPGDGRAREAEGRHPGPFRARLLLVGPSRRDQQEVHPGGPGGHAPGACRRRPLSWARATGRSATSSASTGSTRSARPKRGTGPAREVHA
jgi:CheY-like chemotaxis protein